MTRWGLLQGIGLGALPQTVMVLAFRLCDRLFC